MLACHAIAFTQSLYCSSPPLAQLPSAASWGRSESGRAGPNAQPLVLRHRPIHRRRQRNPTRQRNRGPTPRLVGRAKVHRDQCQTNPHLKESSVQFDQHPVSTLHQRIAFDPSLFQTNNIIQHIANSPVAHYIVNTIHALQLDSVLGCRPTVRRSSKSITTTQLKPSWNR